MIILIFAANLKLMEEGNSYDSRDLAELVARYEDQLRKSKISFFDVEEFEEIVDYYLSQNKVDTAQKVVNTGIDQHPAQVDLKLKKAEILDHNRESQKALIILSEIEAVEPFNTDILYLKAGILSKQKQFKKAISVYRKLLNIENDSINLAEVYYLLSVQYFNLKEYDRAFALITKSIKNDSENLLYIDEMIYYAAMCEKQNECIAFINQLIDEDPYNEGLWIALGSMYEDLELFEKAIEAYEYAIVIDETYTIPHFNKANCFVMLKKYESAIDVYKEILEIEGTNSSILNLIAECYEKQENNDLAIQNYEYSLQLDALNADAWFGLAIIAFYNEDYNKSFEYVQKSLSIELDNPEFLHLLGNIKEKKGELVEALEIYVRVIELDFLNFDVIIDCADLLFDMNKIFDAVDLLQRAVEQSPNIAELSYHLAGYLFITGKHKEGINWLEHAINLNYEQTEAFLECFPELQSNTTVLQIINSYKQTINKSL